MSENTKKSYRVYYTANDGHRCTFVFKSDRSFRRYTNNNFYGKTFGTPFMNDMYAAIRRYSDDPNSKMSQHGGFGGVFAIAMVVCIETGERKLCSAF